MLIFHITAATLVGAMAVFGVAIAMAPSNAQSIKSTWNDLLKPYEAKTNPAVPIAPVAPAAAPAGYSTTPPATSNNTLLDGCVISAIGRLPKVDGLRVTKSSTSFRNSVPLQGQPLDFWIVSVSVDLHGRQANYEWLCRVYANASADLINK